ncbi:MAG TPA: short-chain dehydrogenase, partial [Chloroflexota bacterium]|nr:short-chain dehydrogenase [Chloroflexota bacterium]
RNLGRRGSGRGMTGLMMRVPGLAQETPQGALPTLYAATSPLARGGEYYGPQGFLELTGRPGRARLPRRVRDEQVAARLWDVSERLTGVSFATTLPGTAPSAQLH